VRVRLLVGAAAAALVGAFPAPAFAGEAWMWERMNGDRLEATVHYQAYWAEANDLTISMTNQSRLVIRDRHKYTKGHWGWGGSHGCWNGEPTDAWAAVCEHNNAAIPITELRVYLRDGDDSVKLDSSVLPGLATFVSGETGADTLDVRGGSASDVFHCGSGIDWAYTDLGDRLGGGEPGCETNDHLGGALTSDPAVSSWGEGYLDVFWRGASGDLRHKAYNGGWHPEESLGHPALDSGGALTSKPAAVVAAGGAWALSVYARDAANEIQVKYWDGAWRNWFPLPGTGGATSAPAAVSPRPGSRSVFYRGADNRVYEITRTTDQWWSSATPLGGNLEITSAPAAVGWGQGRIDVFARGGDGALYHQFFEVGVWSGSWTRLGGQLTSAPAVASRGYGKLDVFARGTDNALYRKSYDMNTGWSDWQRLGGELTQGDPAAVSWGNGRIDVFMRGPRDELYELTLFS
jgi:hypothetical protein